MAKRTNKKLPVPASGELLIYQSDDGKVNLDIHLKNETVWMAKSDMAELFQCSADNISLHLKNIYEEGELEEKATAEEFSVVRQEGDRSVRRNMTFYNLDAIISVGYRVKSHIATRFRIWATQKLREYIVKGFVMDDRRLKNPPVKNSPVPDYFDEMLERIRDIRASERRMYLRVREIFSLAGDYDPSWSETTRFFQVIQNKLHFAATGMTAAELIASRANHQLPNMGLTGWKDDVVRKTDVITAKNYLTEIEIDELNRVVVMWLDFAEDQARRRKQIFMKDWQDKLNEFLRFNDRKILTDAGEVSKQQADEYARNQYDKFENARRKYIEEKAEQDYIRQLEDASKMPRSEHEKREGKDNG